MHTADYTLEVRSARDAIARAAMLLESARLSDVTGAGEAIESASVSLERVRSTLSAGPIHLSVRQEMEAVNAELWRLHSLINSATAFFRGWTAIAALSPAAYNPSGNPVDFAIPRLVSVNG